MAWFTLILKCYPSLNYVEDTKTYQTSYMIRVTRIWNILPNILRKKTNSLSVFKANLRKYYVTALSNCYDPEDSRTWKSVCVHCNKARGLHVPITVQVVFNLI